MKLNALKKTCKQEQESNRVRMTEFKGTGDIKAIRKLRMQRMRAELGMHKKETVVYAHVKGAVCTCGKRSQNRENKKLLCMFSPGRAVKARGEAQGSFIFSDGQVAQEVSKVTFYLFLLSM